MATHQPIPIGIIGTGGMGGRHARNLAHAVSGAQVVAVMDVDQKRAHHVAAECGAVHIFNDAHALIAHPEVAAVVIASPDRFHAELTLACLAAGKPVFCEKPLATNVADAKRVIETESSGRQRLVQVGFMREYDQVHQQVKAVLERGEIGAPLLFRGLHTNWEEDAAPTIEEVIVNSAIHDIHSTRWLMSQEIVTAYVRYIPADLQRPDTCRLVVMELTLANGALAIIECNINSGYGYEVDVEIAGTQGMVRTDGFRNPLVRRNFRVEQAIEPDWLVRFDAAYIAEMQSWVQALRQGGATGPSAWDGYASLIVAEACIQAAHSGQPQAVSLPERPAFYIR